jgi:hypothetical protein
MCCEMFDSLEQFKAHSGMTTNGGRYYYYGHMRKQVVTGSRHIDRCPVENISATALEEAVISRLSNLANDKRLIESLVKSTANESKSLQDQQRSLLRSEEEHLKELKTKIDGLLSSISYAPSSSTMQLAYDKIEEMGAEVKAVSENIAELKDGCADNVLDISKVFQLMKCFTKSFEKKAAHQQREIIRDVVRKITIMDSGTAKIEYYKGPREDEIFPGVSFFDAEDLARHRSMVRAVSSMVGAVPVQPKQQRPRHV